MASDSVSRDLLAVLRIYWSLLLGNIVEWYEYAIYGHLASSLEKNFFKGSAIGLWLGFGVTFLARPLGGIVLGVVGDRWGRSTAVNISIVGMLVGTVGQGCLPTPINGAEWLGDLGLVLLVVLRFIQGLSAAGEIVTITTFLTEVCSPRMLCRGVSLIAMTVNLGFLSAKAVTFIVEAAFGAEAVEQWAWRVPFWLAIIPGMIAIMGRRHVPESGMFLEMKEKLQALPEQETFVSKLKQTVTQYWLNMLVGMGGVCAFATLQYSCFVWTQSFLASHGMSPNDRMIVGLLARLTQTALNFFCGWAGDIFGVGSVMLVGTLATMVASVPLWSVMLHHAASLTPVALAFGVGLGCLGSVMTTLPYYFVVELFPTHVRNTAVGISYNLGFAVFGGLSPLMAEVLFAQTHLGPGLLWCAACGVTAFSILAGMLCQRAGLLKMAHVRRTPYFGSQRDGALRVVESKSVATKNLGYDVEKSCSGNPEGSDWSTEASSTSGNINVAV
eukprot:CAMPEP_0206461706 /NCGR_PEP_ID=MMETSP0324_2-20121206/25529_1 /ASSEMBLY_ACC=CAM_ASM_000836 /TAXON_ID=2866 /ORGANISM="Crypthecodinium cohnii, Strain Seligo" /LENGTH=498 /DNA_ID=CAMNT_0053933695 /DNA_START=101 /DNA_END=1597 /DNA_ORIENTATION=+